MVVVNVETGNAVHDRDCGSEIVGSKGLNGTRWSDERVSRIRGDFPILDELVHGHSLVYLDNAATTQVPNQVVEAIAQHYRHDNANVHRGIHTLSERSTIALEQAREKVSAFVHASSEDEIVFTKGTTDSLNIVARMVEPTIAPGATVVVTALEHHANYVPWQQLCARTGASFEVVPLDAYGNVDLDMFERILATRNVAIAAFAHVSNVLGTVNPVVRMTQLAHEHGALAVVDAAQSVRHEVVDVQEIGCDFLAFSGHKMCAPTGIGVLYGRLELLNDLAPVEFGGEMVDKVTRMTTTFEQPPLKFEAGTPNYVGAIGLSAAIDYLVGVGRDDIVARELDLLDYAQRGLETVEWLQVLGSPQLRGGCLSFTVEGVHPFDLATLMDTQGVALRSGNQCAQPLLRETFDVKNVTRLSPAFYNTYEEIDSCLDVLQRVIPLLRASAR